jgi:FtsP/CotA-like multicopper oxidase with cupredoxin domain
MGRTTDSTLRWSGQSDYVTVNATSAQTNAVGANTHEIRVVSTTNCHINIGADPTAAASDDNGIYLPAGVVEYFHVSPGQKVAVVRDSADGVFCLAEMTR